MRISAIECPACNAVIFSRARHDFRYCPCGTVAIDGGFDYKKVCYADCIPRHLFIEVATVDKQILFEDWNTQKDKYGIILKENRQKNLEEYAVLK